MSAIGGQVLTCPCPQTPGEGRSSRLPGPAWNYLSRRALTTRDTAVDLLSAAVLVRDGLGSAQSEPLTVQVS